MKSMSNRAIVASIGLTAATILCIVSTILPWVSEGGSGTNLYDQYFSGTPEVLLVASVVIMVVTALCVFKHNKLTRILNGVIGILAAIVIAPELTN